MKLIRFFIQCIFLIPVSIILFFSPYPVIGLVPLMVLISITLLIIQEHRHRRSGDSASRRGGWEFDLALMPIIGTAPALWVAFVVTGESAYRSIALICAIALTAPGLLAIFLGHRVAAADTQ